MHEHMPTRHHRALLEGRIRFDATAKATTDLGLRAHRCAGLPTRCTPLSRAHFSSRSEVGIRRIRHDAGAPRYMWRSTTGYFT